MKDKPVQENPQEDRRLTIGLVVDDIVMVGGQNALRGAADVARERDVNLLCFHQRMFRSGGLPLEMGPASWDALAEAVDGLVIYQPWPNEETFAAFRSRFPSLPMANALRVYEGCAGLAPDAYQGTKELTCHLIKAHGYRRIAFVTGPEGNWAVEERYRGYADALAEHDLSLAPDLVTPHVGWAGAYEAISLLMDERKLQPGVDFEAVVTSNDTLALGVLDWFQNRGVRVPNEVAVVGFDDDSRAVCSTPPLTTTRVPSYEIGRQAVEAVLAQIAGEQVPEQTLVLPKMMVRRSCGCHALAVTQAAMGPVLPDTKGGELGDVFEAQRAQILSDMVQAVGEDDAEDAVAGWVEQVLNSFVAEMEGGEPGAFLTTLEDVLGQVMAVDGDASIDPGQRVAMWQGAVSALRRWALPYLDRDTGAQAGGLWQQARVMIAVMVEQAQARQTLQAERQAAALREMSQMLVVTLDVGGLADALAGGLPQLGIPGAYLSVYENPKRPMEWSRLMLAYGEKGRVDLGADGLRFPSPQLVPEGMWPPDKRYSYVVEPLFFQEYQIGFALFEMGQKGTVYDTLRSQVSSALQRNLLREQVERRAAQLQTAAEVSRVASSILHVDELIQQVVELVREGFDLYYAGLFLLDEGTAGDPGGKWAVLQAGTGEAGRQMLAQGHKLEVGGESMIGWCIANKQARIALDVGEEAVRFENPFLPETRSELALPLIGRGKAIGALTIQSSREAAFSDGDIAVLQTMTDQLSNAIQNARLLEEQQRSRALLSDRIKELGLLNEIGRKIDGSPQVPDLLGWVAERLPSAMQYPDECVVAIEFEGQIYGAAEAVDLPCQVVGSLRVGGERMGRVTVAYTEERVFLDEESALLGDVVRRLGGYIENRRLFEQMQNALEEVEATQRRYQGQVWTEYLRSARVTGYETGQVDGAPLDDALLREAQQVVEQHRTMALTANGGAAEERSALVVPVTLRGMVIGALGIHDEGGRQWTEEEIALVEAVAERVALAAENLRLLEETQRRAARERLVGDVTARVRETLDMETVLKIAAQELRQSLELPEVVIRLAPSRERKQ